MALTCKGGIRLRGSSASAKTPIRILPPPKAVTVSMTWQAGAPCIPVVAPGDPVDKGQVVGKAADATGCPVHASVSGWVRKVTPEEVIIENDGEDRIARSVRPFAKDLRTATSEELIGFLRAAGITQTTGRAVPIANLIENARGSAKRLLVNGLDSEPMLSGTARLLTENPAAVIGGIKIVLKALGVRSATLAIGENRTVALRKLQQLSFDRSMIGISLLKEKYPQSDSRLLAYTLAEKRPSGKIPPQVREALVLDAESCAAVFHAFVNGMPMITRIVTVEGGRLRAPGNWLVPLGTPAECLLAECGRPEKKESERLICGGRMTGAIVSEDFPIGKSTCGLLLQDGGEDPALRRRITSCLHCGKCVAVCPMQLQPYRLYEAFRRDTTERSAEWGIDRCILCGCCEYSCPAGLPLRKALSVLQEQVPTGSGNPEKEPNAKTVGEGSKGVEQV